MGSVWFISCVRCSFENSNSIIIIKCQGVSWVVAIQVLRLLLDASCPLTKAKLDHEFRWGKEQCTLS